MPLSLDDLNKQFAKGKTRKDEPLDIVAVGAPIPIGADPVPAPDGGRHPFRAGLEAAKTGLGTGLPYALQKAGIGTLTPEEDALYRQQLRTSADKREALLPGGAQAFEKFDDGVLSGIASLPQTIGEQVAYSAPIMGAAVLGGIGGGIAGAAGGPVGAVAGTLAGGAATASPMYVGSNVDRATESGQKGLTQTAAQRSLAVAPIQGAADALIGRVLPGVGKGLGGNLLGRVIAGAAEGATTEAVTETLQQGAERFAAEKDVLGAEAMSEYGQAALLGGLTGGTIGGASGAVRRKPSTLDADRAIGKPSNLLDIQAETTGDAPVDGRNADVPLRQPPRAPVPSRKDVTDGNMYGFGDLPDLDTVLERGIRTVETGSKPDQVSEAGAIGAHQMLPSTAKVMAKRLGIPYDETKLLKDPAYNAKLAKEYLSTLATKYDGDMFKAVTAYHAGPGNVDNWIERFGDPNEVGHDAWLDQIKAVGATRSAAYPRQVFAALGRQIGESPTRMGGAAPSADPMADPLLGMDPLDEAVTQASVAKQLRQGAIDENGSSVGQDRLIVAMSAKLSKALSDADADAANAVIAAERKALDKALADLADDVDTGTSTPAEAEAKMAKLTARERVLNAGQSMVERITQTLSTTQPDLFEQTQAQVEPTVEPEPQINIVTEPNLQMPDLTAQGSGLRAADTQLAEDMQYGADMDAQEQAFQGANSVSAQQQARTGLLDTVLGDETTRNPTRRFLAALTKRGMDASLSPEEAERIARYEDAKAGFTDEAQPDFYQDPGSPDESGDFGIRERGQPKKAVVAEQAQASPELIEQPDPISTNVRTRAETRAKSLGSSRAASFLKGVDAEMGVADIPAPTTKSKANWFEEGRQFVRDEASQQARERGEPAPETKAAVPPAPEPEAKPAPKPKAEPRPEAKAEPAPAARPRSKDRFTDAVVKAEQDGKIDAQASAALRAMAEYPADDGRFDMQNWDALDNAISGKTDTSMKSMFEDAPTKRQIKVLKIAQRNMRKELERLGLGEVAAKAATRMELAFRTGLNGVGGTFEPIGMIIRVALDGLNPAKTFYHEVGHAMRELDLFTPFEWQRMVDYAKKVGIMSEAEAAYTGEDRGLVEEEAVVEAYARWADNQSMGTPPPLVVRAFEKIKKFFEAIANAFKGQGFGTAEDVFAAIQDSKIGNRERGVPRMGERTFLSKERAMQSRFNRAVNRNDAVKDSMKVWQDNMSELGTKAWLWNTSPENIAKAAKDVLPSAMRFIKAQSQGHALAREFEDRLADIKHAYEQLPKNLKGNGKGTINELLDDMTAEGKWAFQPSWNAKAKVDPDMAKRFDAMPVQAQAIIKASFLHAQEMRQQLLTNTVEALEAEYGPLIAQATGDHKKTLEEEKATKLKNFSRLFDTNDDLPYLPRQRSGAFIATGKSQEFLDAEKNNDVKAMDEMRSDPDHYFVRFYDSMGEAKAASKRLHNQYPYSEAFQRDAVGEMELGGSSMYMAFQQLRSNLATALSENPNDKSAKALHQLATDMFLHALADTSARKGEMKSFRVAGKDPVTGEALDMFRAFVSRGQANSHFIAQLANHKEIFDSIQAMHTESKNLTGLNGDQRADAQRFKNELLWHYTENLNRKPNKPLELILRLNALRTLMMKPGYHLTNASQTAVMSIPQLAGQTSYKNAWEQTIKAYTDVMPLLKNSDRVDIRKIKDPVIAKLAQDLQDRGRLGTGMSMDLSTWDMREDRPGAAALNTFNRGLNQFAQNIEDVNRLTAGIAAFRIMKGKGATDEKATEFASNVIADTHGDYSNFNTPRVLKTGGPIMKVATQFRKFQLIMVALNVKMFNDAFVNKNLSKDEKRAAQRAFMFTMAHMAALGGVKGLPAVGAIAGLTAALMGKDWEEESEKSLENVFGKDNPMVGLLLKGAPYELLGTDTSGTLGMGTVFSPLPYVDMPSTTGTKDDFLATIGKIAGGSAGSSLGDMWQAGGHFKEGDYYRALEQVMPTGLQGPMRAYRYATDGYTGRNGDVLMSPEDISFMTEVYTAMGLPASQLTDLQAKRSQAFEAEERFTDRSTVLKRRFNAARKDSDQRRLAAVREDWKKLQEDRREAGFKVQPMSVLLRAPRDQAKRERQTVGGVQYTNSNREYVKELTD